MHEGTFESTQLLERLMEFWNQRAVCDAAEIYADDYRGIDVTDHTLIQGPDGVTRQLRRFREAFPDLFFETEEMIREKNRVALYWSASGTHRGTLLNIPPTGRAVRLNGITLLQIHGGKITRSVHLWDLAALLRAIGLLPELERKHPIDPLSLRDALTIF
jgi:steroid delta-isomerase-like uncharacterized protein